MRTRTTLAALLVAAALAHPGSLEDCVADVRVDPDDLDRYRCFQTHALTTRDFDGAIAALEALPGDPARLWRGHLLGIRGDERGVEPLSESIANYATAGDARAEALGRSFLLRLLTVLRRYDDADEQARLALEVLDRTDDFALRASVTFERARLGLLRDDEGAARGDLRRLHYDARFAELSPAFRAAVAQFLAIVANNLGDHREAIGLQREILALADAHGLDDFRAEARVAIADLSRRSGFTVGATRAEAIALAREAFLLADADASYMGPTNRFLARMALAQLIEGAEGLHRLDALVASTDSAGARYQLHTARGLLLRDDPAVRDPERALDAFRAALAGAEASGSTRFRATALANLAATELRLREPGGVERSYRALDAIERLHELQSGERMAALVFARYAPAYHALIAALIERGEIERAFAVSERMRARTLRERLARLRAEPGNERRADLLERIARLQVRLMDSEDADAERELRRLEAEEETLRRSDLRVGPGAIDAAAVRAELADDEALLAWVLGEQASGGSWLFVLTATETDVVPLEPAPALAEAIDLWLGTIERRDGSEARASASLHDRLLGDASWPAGVRRLIAIPDGAVHRAPLDLLREDPGAAPLVSRHAITHAGSAAVWALLRARGDRARSRDALLFADPRFPGADAWPESVRSAWRLGGPLGRLPHARVEGRAALRALGGRGRLLLDDDASEATLKRARLEATPLVHLATHAIVDDADPARSAVLLAAGGAGEDGLLQAREIVDLRLGGALVTLSGCRSAGGETVAGEGVLGIAHAFLAADAGAVVGSLWPVRDDETARLMAAFYRQIGAGLPIAEALAAAKRERRDAGEPAAAWAGFVVSGDGDRVALAPAGVPTRDALFAVGLAAIAAFVVAIRLRRRRPR